MLDRHSPAEHFSSIHSSVDKNSLPFPTVEGKPLPGQSWPSKSDCVTKLAPVGDLSKDPAFAPKAPVQVLEPINTIPIPTFDYLGYC